MPALDVAQRYAELGDALPPLVNPAMQGKYGLEITSFVLENVSVPPEVEQAIDKRSSMGVVGNLNDYVRYQMGLAMGQGGAKPALPPPCLRKWRWALGWRRKWCAACRAMCLSHPPHHHQLPRLLPLRGQDWKC